MQIKEEKNGYKIGINDNPDVAHLEEFKRWQIEFPTGEKYSGNEQSIRKLFEKVAGI